MENRKEIIIKILDGHSTRLRESYFIKNYPKELDEINLFCENILNISLKEKLWYWVNNINTQFLCKCGKVTTFNKNWIDGYRKSCSPKCSQSDNSTKEKRRNTNLERYGVDNVAKSDIIKSKIEETNLERYGTKSSFQNNEVRTKWSNNLIEKYGVNHISKIDSVKLSIKKTNLERYGKEYYTQTEKYIKDCIVTNQNRYNVDWFSQTTDYKKKTLSTNLEKYGVDHYSKTMEFKQRVNISNLEKYGSNHYYQSDNFKKKNIDTNLEKYGVEHHTKSNDFKEKIKTSNNIKYGVDYYYQSEEFKEISKSVNLEKYGVEHYSKTPEFIFRVKKTSIEKYGVDNFVKNEQFRKDNFNITNNINYIKYLSNKYSLFNCDKGHNFLISSSNNIKRTNSNLPLCTVCYPIGDQKSIKEKELLEYIKSIYSGEIISSYRDGLEIDIYLPELKIGFEFNGLYFHSDKFKDKDYHLNKTNWFNEKGIRIIHIWEDDYNNRLEIIKSQIRNLLKIDNKKIFARKCIIKEVPIKESKQFLDNNHIQGNVSSQIKIGLYIEDKLVSLMTFNSSEGRKKMELGGWNLNRFCNKTGTNVIGGASKLLSYFIKNYEVKRIVSYADKDWSLGNLYELLGFNKVSDGNPDYKYIVDNQRVHKSRYKKDKLGLDDKSITTESNEMSKKGIYRIYDCGKLKFEYKL